MRALLVTIVLVVICLLVSESALLESSVEKEVSIYEVKIRVLHEKLLRECPARRKSKRQVDTSNPFLLEVLKETFAELFKELVECKQKSSTLGIENITLATTSSVDLLQTSKPPPTETTALEVQPTTTCKTEHTITDITPMTTTEQETTVLTTTYEESVTTTQDVRSSTHVATTTGPALPQECQQAVNYTQSWRRDHLGSFLRPGGPNSKDSFACDFGASSSQWFRFSGAAGTHMLDSCPEFLSCGTAYPFWTDERMPTQIGVEAIVKVYGVDAGCKGLIRSVKVMRCSWNSPHNLIYKQTTNLNSTCQYAFCGMM